MTKRSLSARKVFCFSIFVFIITALLAETLLAAEGKIPLCEKITVHPKESTAPLINPGKGWVAYGNAKSHPQKVLDYCTLGYNRYQWAQIEPEEGKFNWSVIERDMKSWSDLGRPFAFGIMGANSHSSKFWVTPQWVFDAGAKYDTFVLKNPERPTAGTEGEKLVPLFDDPIYLEKMNNMVKAFAKRFDGDPNIAFIDIRSYGNWGEGHMFPFKKHNITAEKYQQHLEIYRNAFHKTLLMIPGGNSPFKTLYPKAVEQGMSIRRDGICGNSNGNETAICDNKVPGVFEFYAGYESMKKWGWWDGIQTKYPSGYTIGYTLAECVENGKPTWCSLSAGGKSGLKMITAEPELINKLTNRIGYHHVIHQATWPKTIKPNKPFEISCSWENKGSAYMFFPAKISFALISKEGQIVQTCDSKTMIPRQFKPNTAMNFTESIQFSNLPNGEYLLAVGMFPVTNEPVIHPYIKLAVELPEKKGWYQLGTIYVSDSAVVKTNFTGSQSKETSTERKSPIQKSASPKNGSSSESNVQSLLPVKNVKSITPANFPAIANPAMKWAPKTFAKDPCVVWFKGKYYMYFSLPPQEITAKETKGKSRKFGWTTGIAVSDDLTHWRLVSNILSLQDCDRKGLCAPCAKVFEDRVWLFYQTYGNGSKDAICCAWSDDGINFTPRRDNPIFRPSGNWTNGRAIDAEIVKFQNHYFLYAATRDPAGKIQKLVVATSDVADGLEKAQWKQAADRSILEPELDWETNCIEAPTVVEHHKKLYLFYAGGFNNDPQQIGVAVSSDGLNWTRLWNVPFLPNGPREQWNESESGHPGLFVDQNNQTWLFFQGNKTKGKDWYLSRIRINWTDGPEFSVPYCAD